MFGDLGTRKRGGVRTKILDVDHASVRERVAGVVFLSRRLERHRSFGHAGIGLYLDPPFRGELRKMVPIVLRTPTSCTSPAPTRTLSPMVRPPVVTARKETSQATCGSALQE